MSLNRFEQTTFDYLQRNPDELRHWKTKVTDHARVVRDPGDLSRALERELWHYLEERSQHTPVFQSLAAGGLRRVSLQNLAEHLIRLWGPLAKPKRSAIPGE